MLNSATVSKGIGAVFVFYGVYSLSRVVPFLFAPLLHSDTTANTDSKHRKQSAGTKNDETTTDDKIKRLLVGLVGTAYLPLGVRLFSSSVATSGSGAGDDVNKFCRRTLLSIAGDCLVLQMGVRILPLFDKDMRELQRQHIGGWVLNLAEAIVYGAMGGLAYSAARSKETD